MKLDFWKQRDATILKCADYPWGEYSNERINDAIAELICGEYSLCIYFGDLIGTSTPRWYAQIIDDNHERYNLETVIVEDNSERDAVYQALICFTLGTSGYIRWKKPLGERG